MGVVWTVFSHLSYLSSSLSLGDGPIFTEILSQKAVKAQTTNRQLMLSVQSCTFVAMYTAFIYYIGLVMKKNYRVTLTGMYTAFM